MYILINYIDEVSVLTKKYEEFIDTLKQYKPDYTEDDITQYIPRNISDLELLKKAITYMKNHVNIIN